MRFDRCLAHVWWMIGVGRAKIDGWIDSHLLEALKKKQAGQVHKLRYIGFYIGGLSKLSLF